MSAVDRPFTEGGAPLAHLFDLDPAVAFLNHGSFGSSPRPVTAVQREWQDRFRREPVRFMVEDLEPALDQARARCAAYLGCDPEGFAFVANATTGVNAVVRSLRFEPGDEIITSDHEYNACNNVLRWAESVHGVRLVHATVPFPVQSETQAEEAVLSRVSNRTRLVLLSHITSPTALRMPVERIVAALNSRGIDTLVDGAHAPGHIRLNLGSLNAPYYTGNFHKWTCSPVSSAFLFVRADRRELVRPTVISHGANANRAGRTRFRLEFDYVGTQDCSAYLAVPAALDFMSSLHPSGWDGIMERNRNLALAARDLLCGELGTQPPAPDSMTACMACVPLPDRTHAERDALTRYHDPLQDRLLARYGIQVPIIPFPAPPRRHVRISAQVYNSIGQYAALARAVQAETRP